MKMPVATRLVLAAMTAGSLVFSGSARAEPSVCATGDAECGSAAFARGTEAFDRGDYAAATIHFAAAASADPHPVVVFNLALSEARGARPKKGSERFRALLLDGRLDAALRARIERELQLAEDRLARVKLELTDGSNTRVWLDEQSVDPVSGELAVDPGSHQLRVVRGTEVVFDQRIELVAGERLQVRLSDRTRSIDVVLVPSGGRPKSQSDSAAPSAKLQSGASGLPPGWFFGAAGVTAALAGLTIWSGVDVQNAHDDYLADLPNLDQAGADARVRDGHARERRTNLLLAGTAVCAAGTAVLGVAFTRWSNGEAAPSAQLLLSPLGFTAVATF